MSREQDVRDAIDRFLARLRQSTDTHLEGLSTELLAIVQGDMRSSRTDVERAAVEVARALARGGSHARHDLISRVVVAVRRLDDATTLRGVLDALADGAASEASRVAVLVVDGTSLRSYRHQGFPPGGGPPDLPLNASSLLSSAVTLQQSTPVHPARERAATDVPAFLRVDAGRLGLITPLIVAKAVVAVVYSEGPDRQEDQAGDPVWCEHVEVLVRHASARLESVTAQRTVDVLNLPVGH